MADYIFYVAASGTRAAASVTDGARWRHLPVVEQGITHDAVVQAIRACLAYPLAKPDARRVVVCALAPARQAVERDYLLEIGSARALLRGPAELQDDVPALDAVKSRARTGVTP